jgi:hypothetical protein
MYYQALRTRSKLDNTTLLDYLIARFAAAGLCDVLSFPDSLAHLEVLY